MSWTWRKGFWGEDPVCRFKDDNFFQSGRHKAEERFWVNYVHNDGSFYKPLRSRLSSTSSSFGSRTRNSSSGSSYEPVGNDYYNSTQLDITLQEMANFPEEDNKKVETAKTEAETENDESETTKEDDEISSVTCSNCSKCAQPLKVAEKERYVSRIG
eukprot:GFUD01095804.1.p1 GENE.GFUD01095804.1~~GFUD01095804.1.p1  ORF type:complete len:157 (+),score=41.34 GFUD01095804.1:87-557(+)